MQSIAQKISDKQKKSAVVDVRSGDTVRVHQKVREGGKERVQVFEGLVIKTSRNRSLTSTFTVRRIASGVGVEKAFLIHSPTILKVEVVRRSKVRRNRLNYIRQLTGKSTRLAGREFDKDAVNAVHDEAAEAEEAKLKEEVAEAAESAAAEKAEGEKELEAKAEAAIAAHDGQPAADKIESQPKERPDAAGPEQEQNKEKA